MIYLDNSATTRPCEAAINAMTQCMRKEYFNPSALYAPALLAEKIMRACREEILRIVHAPTGSRVIFTSGGTEADNLAILGGTERMRPGRVLYSAGEHPAVKEACLRSGHEAVVIPYDRTGRADVGKLAELLDENVRMICCMQVNNETGAIQPLSEIARLRKQKCPQALFHVDAVQGFLRVPLDMTALQIDSIAISGHKIHGPKGIGALITAPGMKPHARQVGGGQESDYRSGTENTPGIAGLLAAIRAFPREHEMREMKLRLWRAIQERIPQAVLNGSDPADPTLTAPHILNVSLPPVRSETMLHALEGEGILVGLGSACSSHKQKVSPVLQAMGLPRPLLESALRFSLCPENTMEEMEKTADACLRQYQVLSRYQRR